MTRVTVFSFFTIAMRIGVNVKLSGARGDNLVRALNYVQVGTLIFSTLTNVLSTGIVGAYLWCVMVMTLRTMGH